jgi:hypothetical protein
VTYHRPGCYFDNLENILAADFDFLLEIGRVRNADMAHMAAAAAHLWQEEHDR